MNLLAKSTYDEEIYINLIKSYFKKTHPKIAESLSIKTLKVYKTEDNRHKLKFHYSYDKGICYDGKLYVNFNVSKY